MRPLSQLYILNPRSLLIFTCGMFSKVCIWNPSFLFLQRHAGSYLDFCVIYLHSVQERYFHYKEFRIRWMSLPLFASWGFDPTMFIDYGPLDLVLDKMVLLRGAVGLAGRIIC